MLLSSSAPPVRENVLEAEHQRRSWLYQWRLENLGLWLGARDLLVEGVSGFRSSVLWESKGWRDPWHRVSRRLWPDQVLDVTWGVQKRSCSARTTA
jgi:hypothetical protein